MTIQPDDRDRWLNERCRLEQTLVTENMRQSPTGPRRHVTWHRLIKLVAGALQPLGLYRRGCRNAENIRLVRHDLACPGLPAAFDGYAILFLSDLHVGSSPEIIGRAVEILRTEEVDLAVLGGDYQLNGEPGAVDLARLMAPLAAALRTRDGAVAVLGNHDTHHVVPALEGLNLRMLLNEWLTIDRAGSQIHLLGLDDIHAFYTPAVEAAMGRVREGFRIAVVHSPEFAGRMADAGFALYLAGHTHGGQVALPGGRPLMTALDAYRDLAIGPWRLGEMLGYTSAGLGVGDPPIRFNTRGEAALLRLRVDVEDRLGPGGP